MPVEGVNFNRAAKKLLEHVKVDLTLGERLREEHFQLIDVLCDNIGRPHLRSIGSELFHLVSLVYNRV